MARYSKALYFDFWRDSHYICLEIWRKQGGSGRSVPTAGVKRIADLQGLWLNLQGGTETVEAPILKTTCEVRIVDYPKVNDSDGVDAKGEACTQQWGGWEDVFYTMDSTEFMARIYQDDVLRWCGYLTPDTWEEDLVYAGSITLTFRDNLGHLADLPFDATGDGDGLISVSDIVNTALSRIESPMRLGDLECELMATDGENRFSATEACVSVLAFEEKNWLEALEAVLDSFGLVLRYDDNNKYQLMSIRQMPQTHKRNKGPRAVKDIIFLDRSGHRSKEPVFKTIEENISFDISDDASFGAPLADDFTEGSADVNFETTRASASQQEMRGAGPVHMLIGSHWKTDSLSTSLAFNPYVYKLAPSFRRESLAQFLDNNVYIAANVEQSDPYARYVRYEQSLDLPRGKFVLDFGHPISAYQSRFTDGTPSGINSLGYPHYELYLSSVTYALRYVTDSGVTKWLSDDGSFSSDTVNRITVTFNGNSYAETVEIPFDAEEYEPGTVGLYIYNIRYNMGLKREGVSGAYTVYARIASFTLEPKDKGILPESDKTTTIYNENANVKHTREPMFGTFDVKGLASSRMMPNLIFSPYRSTGHIPLTQWFWKDAEEIQKLSVINAKQILCYHCRAMSYLTGTIADNTADDPRFDDLYQWNGQQLMLISGSLDLLTGFMESAALREFELYYNLWEEEDTRTFFILGGSKLGSDDKLE